MLRKVSHGKKHFKLLVYSIKIWQLLDFLFFVCSSKLHCKVKVSHQNDTKAKSYTELVELLTNHLSPKPNEIAERFMFFKRDRKHAESVNDYIAELRKLSENCNFGTSLNTYLRDRFVCGLNSESVQQKLLTMKDLNLDTALETATLLSLDFRESI